MVTGVDLVEWQFRIAAGEVLPEQQSGIHATGQAIEARIYAEDPERDFLPQAGRLHRLRFPSGEAHVRVDTGIAEGDSVPVHYDPMIAKLIANGADRGAAIDKMLAALGEFRIEGIVTNISFLKRVMAHPAYRDGETHTGFVGEHKAALLEE